jgi:hypothetical protein
MTQNSEQDPTGRSVHAPGAKLDQGKLRAALVMSGFSKALTEVCKIGTHGAEKYSPNGWKSVPNGIERYDDAQERHKLTRWGGELTDPGSKLLHRAHEAWNVLAALELELREEKNHE